MNDDGTIEPLLLLLAVLPVGDLFATIFFARLFWRSKQLDQVDQIPGAEPTFITRLLGGRSWLLALLTASFAIITAAFILIGFLSARRLLGYPPLEGQTPFVVLALAMLGAIPIAFAIAFWQTRRRSRRSATVVETQHQREDREMGDHRRELPSVKAANGRRTPDDPD